MAPKIGYCLLVALVCLVFVSSASVVRTKRDSEMDLVPELTRPTVEPRFTTTLEDKFCQPDTPCGWVVYTPFTRIREYFMRNTYCRCAAPQECVNTGDDISISAFIFRCRVPKPTTVAPSSTTSATES